MSNMIGNRIHGRGPGGRNCPCCAEAPKDRTRIKRANKRRDRQNWKKEIARP